MAAIVAASGITACADLAEAQRRLSGKEACVCVVVEKSALHKERR
ncbi:MAG: hypothetical protein OSJ43_12405 [Oscillospiraceae bacterium]|nr:hypothetical protein [Oscillospiraceae bacterium]